MSELISREAVINSLDAICERECEYSKKQRAYMCGSCHLGSAFDAVDELPSAQPETPPCVAEIESEYKKWVSVPHINKPLAKALYEVWKKHDREDVSRNG